MDSLRKGECQWPSLAPPYDRALREAVEFVLQRFEVLGIIACGTIVRGNPGRSSDLDIYVVHAVQKRQRIQRFFNGAPAEIFVNPVSAIEGYFENEHKAARPLTAHMLATGFVILDRNPVVEGLRRRARELIATRPEPGEARMTMLRYMAATLLEDALDVTESDPDSASMILGLAAHHMLQYQFWKVKQYLPRDKDLLEALRALDPELAAAGRAFFRAAGVEQRAALAREIADRTIETHGFFEWESKLEDMPEAKSS